MRLLPWLIRYFYPWADNIVAVSKGVANDLERFLASLDGQIKVIYNPIVTHELKQKAKVRLEHPWFEKGQPPVILSVGRLAAQKDFITLIKAYARVRQTHPSRLLILGDGEERPLLESFIQQLGLQQDVCMPGFIANPYPFMMKASLFVLSSRWEGLPGVLIEAMYCGVPLIATDCPSGPREILKDGKHGVLVPVGDEKVLSQAIIRTLEGKVVSPSSESWRPFDMETVVSSYIKLLFEE
jgi:glycosyltransferase involved in cell wall biosynthesis